MLRKTIKKNGYKALYTSLYQIHQLYCKIRNPEIYGAYVLCQYNHEVLLIKNSYRRYWTLPCGGLATGESPMEAAVREVREEIGVHLESKNLRLNAKILYEGENMRDHIHLFSYRFARRPTIHIDHKEVEDYRWVDKENVQKHILFEPIIPYIYTALKPKG